MSSDIAKYPLGGGGGGGNYASAENQHKVI